MNRVYKIIWSKAKQSFAVVSECSRAQGKGGISDDRRARAAISTIEKGAVAAAMVLMFSGQALAGAGTEEGNAEATSKDSIAIGSNLTSPANEAKATGGRSTAIGDKAKATGSRSLAIGEGTKATEDQAVAIGSKNTRALGDQSIAIGGDTNALGGSSIAIGGDDIDSVANTTGVAWNNYGVSNEDFNNSAIAIKYKQKTGQYLVDNTNSATRFVKTTGKGDGTVAIGAQSYAGGALAAAVGTGSKAGGFAATAFGIGAKATKDNSIALGAGSITSLANASERNADGSLKFEAMDILQPDGTIRNLTAAEVQAEDEKYYSAIYVPNAKVGKLDASGNFIPGEYIEYTGFAGGTTYMEPGDFVSVGSRNYERQIKHVAAGQISPESTDAINGSQLFAVTDSLQDQIKEGSKTYFHFNDPGMTQGTGNVTTNLGGVTEKAGAEGDYSVTAGVNARAIGENSVAIGKDTMAKGNYDVAIGEGSGFYKSGSSNSNVAIGREAGRIIRGTGMIAVGHGAGNNVFTSDNSMAFGTGAGNRVHGEENIAQGKGAGSTVRGQSNIATGSQAGTNVYGGSNIALGMEAGMYIGEGSFDDTPLANDNPSQGSFTTAADNNISIGLRANKFEENKRLTTSNNIALGVDSKASGGESIAMGLSALAESVDSTAIGTDAHATNERATAMGVDAVASGISSLAIGDTANASGLHSVAIGLESVSSANNTVALGRQAKAEANDATVLGTQATATQKDSVAVGYSADATADSAVAVGKNAQGAGIYSVAVGLDSNATGNGAVTMGSGSGATADYTVALGNDTKANAAGSTALGRKATAKVVDGVALGSSSVADVDKGEVGEDPLGAVTNKANSTWTATTAAVSVGKGTDITRQITSVAAGTADTDAVNVAQLKAAGFKLTTSASAGGEVSGTTEEKVQNGETVTVDAGKNIKITQDGQKVSVATKDDVEFNSVTIGDAASPADSTTLTSGTDGLDIGGDKITNVADGAIGATSKDAINGSQLFDTNNQVAGNTTALGGGAAYNPVTNTYTKPTYQTVDAAGNPVAGINDADNVGDALTNLNTYVNKGFNVQERGTTKGTVTPTESIDFVDGALTTARVTTEADGVTKITFDVDSQSIAEDAQLPVVYTKADGTKVYKQPDGTFNESPDGSGATVAPADIIASMQNADGTTTAPSTLANVNSTIGHNNGEGAINEADAKNAAADLLTKTDGLSTASTVGDLQAIAQAGLDFAGDDSATTTIHKPLGTKLEIIGGADKSKLTDNNIGVNSTADGKLKVQLAKDITGLDSVVLGDAAGDDVVSLSKDDGINAGQKKITNVADGDISAASKDAINGSQLFDTNNQVAGNTTALGGGASYDPATDTYTKPTYSTVDAAGNPITGINDADNVGDALKNINTYVNKGFNVQERGVTKGTVTPTESIDFVDGALTTARVTTEANGVTKITFDVDTQGITESAQLPVVYTNSAGDKLYKQPDGTFNTAADGSGNQVQPADVIASMQNGAGSTTTPTTLANVKAGTDDTDAVNVSQLKGAVDVLGGGAAVNPDGTIEAPTYTLTDGNPSTGGTTNYNNVGDALTGLNTAVNKPLTFTGNVNNDSGADGSQQKLGSSLNIHGGLTGSSSNSNIKTVVTDNDIDIQIADAPVFTGKVSAKGLDAGGEKITNVFAGSDDADAVNYKQLKDALYNAQIQNQTLVESNSPFSYVGDVNGSPTQLVRYVNGSGDVEWYKPEQMTGGVPNAGESPVTATDIHISALNPDGPQLTTPTRVTNVAAGKEDTDAVNVTQLKNSVDLLGGGAAVNADGTIEAPTYTLTDGNPSTGGTTDYNNVGDALTGLNTAVTKPITFKADTNSDTDSDGSQQRLGSEFSILSGDLTDTDFAGANLATEVKDGQVLIGIAKRPKFESVTLKDGGNETNLTTTADGLSVGGDKITDVADGTIDAASKDAVNGSQLFDTNKKVAGNTTALGGGAAYNPVTDTYTKPTYKTVDAAGNPVTGITDADNVGDALTNLNTYVNKGFNVKERGTTKGTVTPTESIDFVDGALTTARVTTEADGVTKITFDVDSQSIAEDAQLPVVYTKADGTKVYRQADGTFNEAPDGTGAVVAPADVIASMQNADGTTATPTALANVNSTIGHNNGEGAINEADAKNAAADLLTKTDGLSTASTVGDLQAIAQAGLDFAGDDSATTTIHKPLGSKLEIIGGADKTKLTDNNIGVNATADGKLKVQLAKDLTGLDSVVLGDAVGDDVVSLTKADGINAGQKKVTNVADGTIGATSKDAINGSQLFDTNNQVAGNTTALGGGASYDPATDTYTKPTYSTVDAAGNPITGINDADNVGDALTNLNTYVNKGFNVQERGVTKGTVTPTESIDFVDGALTTARVTTEADGVTKITFDVDSQGIAEAAQLPVVYTKADGTKVYKQADGTFNEAPDGSGTIVAPADIIASMQNADGTTTTPSTLANVNSTVGHNNGDGAINEAAAKTATADLLTKTDGLSTASTVGDLQAVAQAGLDFAGDDSATTTIHKPLGSKLEIIGGADKTKLTDNNIGVNATADGKLKVQLAENLTGLDSIVLGAATGDDVVSITKDNGINAGQKKITNVAAGDISATSMDAVNGSQLFAVAAGSKEEVKSSDKSVTVTTTTNAAGANVYDLQIQVDANTMQFVDTDPADPSKGKKLTAVTSDITSNQSGVATATVPSALVTAGDVVEAVNNAGWIGTAGAGVNGGMVMGAGDQLVKTGEKVTFDAGKNIKLVQNGQTFTYSTKDEVQFDKVTTGNTVMTSSGVTAPSYKTNGNHTVTVSGNTGTINGLTNKTFDPNNYTSGQAATEDQLASINEAAYAGFNITANGKKLSNAGPGDTVDFNNRDGNILIQNNGNSLTFDLNPDLHLHSVTTGNTQINTNGLFIKDGLSLTKDGLFIEGGPRLTREGLFVQGGPSVTTKGIDAANKPITNVARGTRPGDAVNLSQLEEVDERGSQGIAAALAAASLPQAYTPGTNLMTAGAGTYRGKSAVAIGYSAISDNGKWIFKGSASANQEDAGFSVGVGYQW